jgi:hypothetical protein
MDDSIPLVVSGCPFCYTKLCGRVRSEPIRLTKIGIGSKNLLQQSHCNSFIIHGKQNVIT